MLKIDASKTFSLLCSGNMSDFNFVVNSLWPDIVEKFELQLPMVFSAGKGYYNTLG